jgi:hypothetical protein
MENEPSEFWDEMSKMAEQQSHRNKQKFPITIDDIVLSSHRPVLKDGSDKFDEYVGKFCIVKAADNKKTHIGLLIGFSPIQPNFKFRKDPSDDKRKLKFSLEGRNPSIFVFDRNEVLFGFECWWKPLQNLGDLEDEKIMKSIDKNNAWYKIAKKHLDEEDGEVNA